MKMRPIPILSGLTLIAAYARLAELVAFRAELGKGFVYLNWREGFFWLSHYSLLVPGLLLLGYGLAPVLAAPLAGAWRRLRGLTAAGGWAAVAAYAGLLFTLAVLGRGFLLLDLPITNDEHTVLFGARIMAEGQITAPSVDEKLALPLPFVHRREGRMYSMDFPGPILFAAASLVSGLGSRLYALLAALSGVALAVACGRLDGRRGTVAAALFWLLSPMVLSLSYTGHAHLLSRSFVALAFAVYLYLLHPGGRGGRAALLAGGALGIFAAAAFVCRPAEAGAVLAPVALHLLWRAWKGTQRFATVSAAGVTWLLAPLLLAWYNVQTTGSCFVLARVQDNKTMHQPWWPSLWERLGDNLGFNVMMLIVWFLGPLGAALASLGLAQGGALARVLGASLALQLALALFHSDTGNHLVGPIHYSEAAVPLLLLSIVGLRRLAEGLGELSFSARSPLRTAADSWHGGAGPGISAEGGNARGGATAAVLIVSYLAGLAVFNLVHSATLRDQATINRAPLAAVEGLEHAVVIADRLPELWFTRPEIGEIGSWVADLPHPDPFLRDEVLFVYSDADPEALLARFPDRAFYRMTYRPTGEPIVVTPLRAPGRQPGFSGR